MDSVEKLKSVGLKAVAAIGGGLVLGSAATFGTGILDDFQDDSAAQTTPQEADFQAEEKEDEVRTESSQLADQLEVNNSGEVERQLYSC